LADRNPGPYGADDRAAKRLRRETGGSAVRRRPKRATGPGPTPLCRSRTTGRAPRYLARAADRGRDDARRGDAEPPAGPGVSRLHAGRQQYQRRLRGRRCRMIPEPGWTAAPYYSFTLGGSVPVRHAVRRGTGEFNDAKDRYPFDRYELALEASRFLAGLRSRLTVLQAALGFIRLRARVEVPDTRAAGVSTGGV